MAMSIDYENNELRFAVPNSEALIVAQHLGIADRTVGSYYMSERYDECKEFFNDFTGDYFLDITRCYTNAVKILNKIEDMDMSKLFKYTLSPQTSTVNYLANYEDKSNFYKIDPPFTNENQKYLKLNIEDSILNLIRELILGDLVDLVFKKIGDNGYIVYIEMTKDFDNKMITIHKKCIGI